MTIYKNKKGITLFEAMITTVIISFLAGYAYKIYFGSRETMRHTIAQSQIQSDMRVMLDHLEEEMATCYSFDEIDTENKKFSFYSFLYNKVPLDYIYYDSSGQNLSTGTDSKARILVCKYEYSLSNDGKILKSRTPGNLYFLQEPMNFQPSNSGEFDNYKAYTNKEMVSDIVDFEIKAYSQKRKQNSTEVTIKEVTKEKSADAAFIVLRLHAKIDESANRRDEELDIVTKFYSNYKLTDVANPNSFSSTDHNGQF